MTTTSAERHEPHEEKNRKIILQTKPTREDGTYSVFDCRARQCAERWEALEAIYFDMPWFRGLSSSQRGLERKRFLVKLASSVEYPSLRRRWG